MTSRPVQSASTYFNKFQLTRPMKNLSQTLQSKKKKKIQKTLIISHSASEIVTDRATNIFSETTQKSASGK